jgi:hypothetical protein
MRQVPDDRIDPRRRASFLGREGPTVRERRHDPCDPAHHSKLEPAGAPPCPRTGVSEENIRHGNKHRY